MNTADAIKLSIDMAKMICTGYLGDLTDEEMMQRPCAGCNHINWQVGHLINSDHQMIEGVAPGVLPPLPDGFAERYNKDAAGNDDAAAFDSKETLMGLYESQTASILEALGKMTDEGFDKPAPESMQEYAPNVGAAFSMIGSHWLMHAGQWVIVRRQNGRPPLF